MFNFEEALRRLKLGAKIQRKNWESGYYQIIDDKLYNFYSYKNVLYKKILNTINIEHILAEDWFDPAE